jgi:hypothetical protein
MTWKKTRNRKTIFTAAWMVALIVLAGCGFGGARESMPTTAQPQPDKTAETLSDKAGGIAGGGSIQLVSDPLAVRRRTACPIPAGWVLYQVAFNETIYSLAARGSASPDDLLRANCLPEAHALRAGAWIAVPPIAAATSPQTFLPLGVGAFVADPVIVPAGGMVTLAWQAQGPVVYVRIGWMYGDQFIEEVGGLPSSGAWILRVPDDGRELITYVVRVSDGISEVTAQTMVRVRCGEGWFFSPAPPESGCPLPPLVTSFQEQAFERGTMVYIPALRVHYALVRGQAGYAMTDTFAPGMPLIDPALNSVIPAGLQQPRGAINLAWRTDKRLQAALGYAVGEARVYTGMHQRAVSAGGEVTYFSSSGGQVFQFADGKVWNVIAPQ